MLEKIIQSLKISDDKSDYLSSFTKIEIPAKTTLLEEGYTASKLYIVEKGAVRAWYNHNGKDITLQFFFENQAVASIESLKKNVPSLFSLETIEPSTLWVISKTDLLKVIEDIKTSPKSRDLFIDSLFDRMFDYMRYFLSFVKDSPEQRYQHILTNDPQLVQRVPQH